MAKGDWVKVKSEIGGKLEVDDLQVSGAGGNIEVDWADATKKGLVYVRLLGRTGKAKRAVTFALSAIRSVEEFHRDAD